MELMEKILGSIRRPDGIQVLWKERKAIKSRVFSFDAIISMQVNALDLLVNPPDYRIDIEDNRIRATKFSIFSTEG